MSLKDYLSLDEFWQEGVFQSVQHFVREQNKEQEKALNSMTSKLEEIQTPYSSPLNSMPRPNFSMG